MQSSSKDVLELNKRFELLMNTPASFNFFVAVHDFVEKVERHPDFSKLTLTPKYAHLKQVYQGLEDSQTRTDNDLGHDRYMVIQDLLRIQQEEVSDSNPLWKKRDLLRTLCADIYEKLNAFAKSESLTPASS